MGFLEDAMQVPDLKVLPNGTEVQLQIKKATLGTTSGKDRDTGEAKPVRPMVTVMLTVVSDPDVEPIYFRMLGSLPDDSDDVKKMRLREAKSFAKAMGINPATDGDVPMEQYTGKADMPDIPIPGWLGKTGWAAVGIETFAGAERNIVARWTIPA